jgi:hypothetical protein
MVSNIVSNERGVPCAMASNLCWLAMQWVVVVFWYAHYGLCTEYASAPAFIVTVLPDSKGSVDDAN